MDHASTRLTSHNRQHNPAIEHTFDAGGVGFSGREELPPFDLDDTMIDRDGTGPIGWNTNHRPRKKTRTIPPEWPSGKTVVVDREPPGKGRVG
jgi:hypothetical protein